MTDRSQRGRLLLDVGLLAAILIGLVLVAAPGTPYMSDEGNVYLQVEALMAGEWVVPYAFADLDPGFELRHLQRGLLLGREAQVAGSLELSASACRH